MKGSPKKWRWGLEPGAVFKTQVDTIWRTARDAQAHDAHAHAARRLAHGSQRMVRDARHAAHGPQRTLHGAQLPAHGACCVTHGARCTAHGARRMAHGAVHAPVRPRSRWRRAAPPAPPEAASPTQTRAHSLSHTVAAARSATATRAGVLRRRRAGRQDGQDEAEAAEGSTEHVWRGKEGWTPGWTGDARARVEGKGGLAAQWRGQLWRDGEDKEQIGCREGRKGERGGWEQVWRGEDGTQVGVAGGGWHTGGCGRGRMERRSARPTAFSGRLQGQVRERVDALWTHCGRTVDALWTHCGRTGDRQPGKWRRWQRKMGRGGIGNGGWKGGGGARPLGATRLLPSARALYGSMGRVTPGTAQDQTVWCHGLTLTNADKPD
eukprot:354339-Chlamydomonas_euryale.AAC.2